MAIGYPEDAAWRDSARPVRFFIFDYRACLPLLLLIFFPSLDTLIMMLFAILFFTILERYGFTVVVFFRLLRGLFGGSLRVACPWWLRAKLY